MNDNSHMIRRKKRSIPTASPEHQRELRKRFGGFSSSWSFSTSSFKHFNLIRLLSLKRLKGKTIFEVGCGSGGLSFLLSSRIGKREKGGKLVAIDLQTNAIQICNEKLALLRKAKTKEEYEQLLRENIPEEYWGKDDLDSFKKLKAENPDIRFVNKKSGEMQDVNADLTVARYVLNTYTRYYTRDIYGSLGGFLGSLERNTKKGGRIVIIDGASHMTTFTRFDMKMRGYKARRIGKEVIFSKTN